ncbi:MAG: LysE/ArgO family amino acid transporter [Tumebacillaceae bacterium]
MLTAFLHGFLLAFGLILPLGVQNVFVFNQGAAQRRWVRGLPVVLTAALCDTLLISAAVLGVSVVVLQVGWMQKLLTWGGVAFLLYMGWMTWKSVPGDNPDEEAESWPAKRQILFAMSVSLLNPHAILDTIGVIGTSSLGYAGAEKFLFALACIVVSWLWFLGLMTAGHLLGSLQGAQRWRVLLNRVSAVIMWMSAVYLVLQ